MRKSRKRRLGKLRIFAWTSLALLPLSVFADSLVWKQTEVEIAAKIEQETVEAVFPFKNTGDQEITIQSVNTSCGCTVAAPNKKTYGPGEEGEIRATFTLGDRMGIQEKTILVQSSDAAQPTTLALKVVIPEAFALEPRFLMWSAGKSGPAEEKTATLTATAGQTIAIAAIEADSPEIESRVLAEEPGKRYRVTLRPKTTATPFKSLLRLRIACPPGKDRTDLIYVIVR